MKEGLKPVHDAMGYEFSGIDPIFRNSVIIIMNSELPGTS
jgi:hypothetical protein